MGKKKRNIFRVLSRVHWKSFIILVLFALYISPIFSTPALDKSELRNIKSTIADIECHAAKGRIDVYWITFSTSDGKQFYYRPTGDGKKAETTRNAVELLESYSGEKLTVFYTEKKELSLSSLLFFSGYERVVAIECGQDIIFSLDEFNLETRGARIESGIISGVFLIIALTIFSYPIISEVISYNRKQKKIKQKKIKQEIRRKKFEQGKTGDGSVS